MRFSASRMGAAVFGVLMLCATVWVDAQTDRAGIVGKATDATGGVLPGVEIGVTNTATGPAFSTVTDENGRYKVPRILPPGSYTVTGSLPGFKTTVSAPFQLKIGDERVVDLSLEVGEITQEVTVTSETPLLDTETSSVGEVIEGRQVVELPLKDRNFTQLATLTPGVGRAFVGALTDQTFFNQGDPNAGSIPGGSNAVGSTEAARFSRSGGASISANGLRPTQNNFSLDGVDNNEPQFGTIGVFPNPDAIQEFKVETSVPKAEIGRGGAVVNTTFKSGTNEFHGSLYYYGQNDALNALHPITKRNNSPKPIFRIHEFGGTFGGPIARDKTFFFFDYLGQRNSLPVPFQTAVPTARSRMGDFSEFDEAVRDPLTGQPFPGNVIPNLQGHPSFVPQSFALLNLYPLPTRDVRNPGPGNQNFFSSRLNEETIDSYDIKVDHRFGQSNSLSGRYSFSDQIRLRDSYFEALPAGFGAGDEIGDTRQLVISDTHVFRPSLINEFRFGWTQVSIGILNPGVGGTQGISASLCEDLGIPNCNDGSLEASGIILTGGFGTGEFEFVGDGGLFRVKSDNFYVSDAMTVIKGNHTLKAGFEARPRYLDTIDGGRSGGLKGHLQFVPGFSGDASTGNVQGDYLLGVPAAAAFRGVVPGGRFNLQTTEWGFYVQDDWKVRDDLTLNLGLRYDIFLPANEDDHRTANFLPATGQLVDGDDLIDTDLNNLGPRLGFAWAVSPERKIVLRGGYGLLYAQDGVDYPPLIRNPPHTSSVTLGTFNGFPEVFTLGTGPPLGAAPTGNLVTPDRTLFFLEPNQTVAEIQEWNLNLQWEFANNYLWDIGYVGNHATHLLATRQLGAQGTGLGLARTPGGQAITNVTGYENRSSSAYNGLQTKLIRRFSDGLEFRMSYTWSHAIDDSTGVFNGAGESRGSEGGPINPFDTALERSSSNLDVRHRFSANAIWDIPVGRGRRYGSDLSGGAEAVLGGWQTNFIFSGQTGQHFDVSCDSPSGRTRCDLVGDPRANPPANRYLDPAAFASPSRTVTNLAGNQIFYGTLGRMALTGPGFFRTDFSIFKNFLLTERVDLQFGVEFFNLFNQNDPFLPNNFVGNPGAGNIEGNFGMFDNALPGRSIQYRLKLFF